MPRTFLFTWNPLKTPMDFSDWEQQNSWSCGKSNQPREGDGFFMVRLGSGIDRKGIFASGKITSSPWSEEWEDIEGKRHTGNQVGIKLVQIIDPETDSILDMEILNERVSDKSRMWNPQQSGTEIPQDLARKLEHVWQEYSHKFSEPRTIDDNKAIIIAVNPELDYQRGNEDVGNIDAHINHIIKEGAVFWSLVAPGDGNVSRFNYPEINHGYFYSVPDKAVTHEFDVEYIKAGSETFEEAGKYLIGARKIAWRNKSQRERYFWVKMSSISPLKKNRYLQDFKKARDGQPPKSQRNYIIVIDSDRNIQPKYTSDAKQPITQEEFETEISNEVEEVKKCSNKELIKRIEKTPLKPESKVINVLQPQRNQNIIEYAKRRAVGICQLCGSAAPFNDRDGNPFLEVHHIIWLSREGNDCIENAVALCPNCHRQMHILDLKKDREKLKAVARRTL